MQYFGPSSDTNRISLKISLRVRPKLEVVRQGHPFNSETDLARCTSTMSSLVRFPRMPVISPSVASASCFVLWMASRPESREELSSNQLTTDYQLSHGAHLRQSVPDIPIRKKSAINISMIYVLCNLIAFFLLVLDVNLVSVPVTVLADRSSQHPTYPTTFTLDVALIDRTILPIAMRD
ncbi:uncharacterized protein EDB93DRAFT_77774 [Suillus bovinus]|uniref:uncharacterized protein n=1 Tax=Suillus bovinus TaxID=48563 RepID=UPI001B872A5B|nr:uncharacterized protein EDB93DRAFT_77774 [Suillus bovinus]KAG2130624.1 hypothetical protein EDB93DRAFT_77774 [Suillus bovinus]